MKYIKLIFFALLSVLLGLIFIYSGYTKLYPIEPFELTFIDLSVANWQTAPFIARLMISIEFFIGTMLITNIAIKKVSKWAMIVLLVFSIYLIFILIKEGNNGNCGCFGTHIVMTPLQALIKNILMFGLLLFLYFFYAGFTFKRSKYISILILIISLAMPHVLNYVDMNYSQSYLLNKKDAYPFEADTLIIHAQTHTPPKELKQGKHIIAFMSLTCPHCRIAAKKIRLMKENNHQLPFYFVLNGDEKDLKVFFEDTKATNIPYCMLLGKPFIYLAGVRMPTIYMVQNDTIVNKIDYLSLQQNEIENWLKK